MTKANVIKFNDFYKAKVRKDLLIKAKESYARKSNFGSQNNLTDDNTIIPLGVRDNFFKV